MEEQCWLCKVVDTEDSPVVQGGSVIELLILCASLLVGVFITKRCLEAMLWFLGKGDK